MVYPILLFNEVFMSDMTPSQKPFRILSLDGGGIRGVITARILQEVESKIQEHCGQSLAEYFDMIAGTSTGSLLAAAVSLGYSPAELIAIYTGKGLKIFPYRSLTSPARWKLLFKHGLSAPKFSNQGLVDVISNMPHFKREDGSYVRLKDVGKTEGQAQPRPILLILAYDALCRNTTFFTNHHPANLKKWYDELPLWKICVASASAPTFFPACELTHEEHGDIDGKAVSEHWSFPHVDGGVTANNPSLCAVAQTLKLGHRLEDIQLLSIGTGQNKKPLQHREIEGWGLIQWGLRIADVFMEGQAELQSEVCQQLMGGLEANRYLRLQFDLNDCFGEPQNYLAQAPVLASAKRKNRWLGQPLAESMDDATAANVSRLVDATERYLELGNVFENRFQHYGSVKTGIDDFILNPSGKRMRHEKSTPPQTPRLSLPLSFWERLAQDSARRGLGRRETGAA